ncbi:MAG: hypothetical protein K0U64_07195 [Actinomycetia bacterium]|nr:hypothetical protein [Actinomycetes bacterium]
MSQEQIVDAAAPSGRPTAVVIYAAITILGVISALTVKGYTDDAYELGAIVIGSTLALIIAHAWSEVLATAMFSRTPLSRDLLLHEFKFAAYMGIPAGLTVLLLLVMEFLSQSFDVAVLAVMLAIVALLFVAATVGSRRQEYGWGRSLAWGVASALVGLIAVVVKVVLGA